MTLSTDLHPPKHTIFGEYSLWPRPKSNKRRVAWMAGGAGSAALFAHCVLPMLIGA